MKNMQLGITTLQKNRAPWIKEWIVFHYLVGFRKFYIFTHNCNDNTQDILKKLKKNIDIKIINFDGDFDAPQLKAFEYSCDNFLKEVDWMAFLDGDEFLFPTKDETLEKPLLEYSDKKLSALGVYWVCFGSSYHIKEPKGPIIKNFQKRPAIDFINNKHIKSIVRGKVSDRVSVGENAHLFKTKWGTFDEKLRAIKSGFTSYSPSYEKLRINHYVCQSRSYFSNFKKHSGAADGSRNHVRSEDWWKEHDLNQVTDNSMDRFVKPLENLLNKL